MRLSIIAADNVIVIDGAVHESNCSGLMAKGISALQWYGDEGEIEYVGHMKPNELTKDLKPFQQYIDRAKLRKTEFDETHIAFERAEKARLKDPATRGAAHTIQVLRETLKK